MQGICFVMKFFVAKVFCEYILSIGLFEVLSPNLLTRESYIFMHLGV